MHSKTVFVYFAILRVNRFSAYPTAEAGHHTASHFAAWDCYLDPESIPVEVDLSTLECESEITRVTDEGREKRKHKKLRQHCYSRVRP